MARIQRFERSTIWVESSRGWNGRSYLAWRPHISRWFGDRKSLLKWLSWPIKTTTGDELRLWLDGLDNEDQLRVPADSIQEVNSLDPSDPQFATKTII